MKTVLVLLSVCAMCMWSCTKKADVQCFCAGGTGQNNFVDYGIQKNPSTQAYTAKCDTYGVHNGLDSCYLLMLGK